MWTTFLRKPSESTETIPGPDFFDMHGLFYRWPVVVYCIAIYVQSAFPTDTGITAFPGSDKILHFAGYALFTLLTIRMLHAEDFRPATGDMIITAVAFSVFYGITDEIHQLFVPGRCFELFDVAADAAGSMAAGVASYRFIG